MNENKLENKTEVESFSHDLDQKLVAIEQRYTDEGLESLSEDELQSKVDNALTVLGKCLTFCEKYNQTKITKGELSERDKAVNEVMHERLGKITKCLLQIETYSWQFTEKSEILSKDLLARSLELISTEQLDRLITIDNYGQLLDFAKVPPTESGNEPEEPTKLQQKVRDSLMIKGGNLLKRVASKKEIVTIEKIRAVCAPDSTEFKITGRPSWEEAEDVPSQWEITNDDLDLFRADFKTQAMAIEVKRVIKELETIEEKEDNINTQLQKRLPRKEKTDLSRELKNLKSRRERLLDLNQKKILEIAYYDQAKPYEGSLTLAKHFRTLREKTWDKDFRTEKKQKWHAGYDYNGLRGVLSNVDSIAATPETLESLAFVAEKLGKDDVAAKVRKRLNEEYTTFFPTRIIPTPNGTPTETGLSRVTSTNLPLVKQPEAIENEQTQQEEVPNEGYEVIDPEDLPEVAVTSKIIESKTSEEREAEFAQRVKEANELINLVGFSKFGEELQMVLQSTFGITGINTVNPSSNNNIIVNRQEDGRVEVITPLVFANTDGKNQPQDPKLTASIKTSTESIETIQVEKLQKTTFNPDGTLESFVSNGLPQISVTLSNGAIVTIEGDKIANDLQTTLDAEGRIKQVSELINWQSGFSVKIAVGSNEYKFMSRVKDLKFEDAKVLIELETDVQTKFEDREINGGIIEFNLQTNEVKHISRQALTTSGLDETLTPSILGEGPVLPEDAQDLVNKAFQEDKDVPNLITEIPEAVSGNNVKELLEDVLSEGTNYTPVSAEEIKEILDKVPLDNTVVELNDTQKFYIVSPEGNTQVSAIRRFLGSDGSPTEGLQLLGERGKVINTIFPNIGGYDFVRPVVEEVTQESEPTIENSHIEQPSELIEEQEPLVVQTSEETDVFVLKEKEPITLEQIKSSDLASLWRQSENVGNSQEGRKLKNPVAVDLNGVKVVFTHIIQDSNGTALHSYSSRNLDPGLVLNIDQEYQMYVAKNTLPEANKKDIELNINETIASEEIKEAIGKVEELRRISRQPVGKTSRHPTNKENLEIALREAIIVSSITKQIQTNEGLLEILELIKDRNLVINDNYFERRIKSFANEILDSGRQKIIFEFCLKNPKLDTLLPTWSEDPDSAWNQFYKTIVLESSNEDILKLTYKKVLHKLVDPLNPEVTKEENKIMLSTIASNIDKLFVMVTSDIDNRLVVNLLFSMIDQNLFNKDEFLSAFNKYVSSSTTDERFRLEGQLVTVGSASRKLSNISGFLERLQSPNKIIIDEEFMRKLLQEYSNLKSASYSDVVAGLNIDGNKQQIIQYFTEEKDRLSSGLETLKQSLAKAISPSI